MQIKKAPDNTPFGKNADNVLKREIGFAFAPQKPIIIILEENLKITNRLLLKSVLNRQFSACFHAPPPSVKTVICQATNLKCNYERRINKKDRAIFEN